MEKKSKRKKTKSEMKQTEIPAAQADYESKPSHPVAVPQARREMLTGGEQSEE